jgi:hypothetical protein
MPNWCSNTLTITGDKKEREKLTKYVTNEGPSVDEDERRIFSFNKIIPMPQELHVESNGQGQIGYEAWYGNWEAVMEYEWVRPKMEGRSHTREGLKEMLRSEESGFEYERMGKIYHDNIERYGCPTWYEWHIQNWGTKWDACEPAMTHEKHETIYTFDTAWSPPEKVIIALSKRFPNLMMTLEFREPGMAFEGTLVCKGGAVIAHEEHDFQEDWHSHVTIQ